MTDLAAAARSTSRPSAGSSTSTARSTPASRPRRRRRGRRSQRCAGAGAGGATRAPLLRRPRCLVAAVEAAGGTVTEGPYDYPGREAVPLHRPERQRARRLRALRRSSGVRPDLGRARGHHGPARGVLQRAERASRRGGHLHGRHRSAVVGQRQLGDDLAAQAPGGELDAARGSAVGGVERGTRRRSISSSATSGRHRATSRAASALALSSRAERSPRSASPTSGSWRREAACSRHCTARPTRCGTRGDPRRAGDRGLAHLEGVGVERGRSAQAEQVALDGQGQAERVATAVPHVERASRSVIGGPHPRRRAPRARRRRPSRRPGRGR